MNKKILLFFSVFVVLILDGAGCASSGPQAKIASPSLGKDDAPIQMVVYFDYQCPSCRVAEDAVIPFVISDYVDTGKVKLTFNNMAFIGPESRLTANAALCAAEGGKFLDYHKKLFEIQGAENSGVYTEEKLKEIAEQVGLDSVSFGACIDSKKYQSQVIREYKEAQAAGVNATPNYLINGQLVHSGTYLSIKRVIDKKLEEVKKIN